MHARTQIQDVHDGNLTVHGSTLVGNEIRMCVVSVGNPSRMAKVGSWPMNTHHAGLLNKVDWSRKDVGSHWLVLPRDLPQLTLGCFSGCLIKY